MKERYYINGWEYGRQYFMSVGHFNENELDVLRVWGDPITKNGNKFSIVVEEEE